VPTLKIANRIYFDDGNMLHRDYKSVVGSYAKQIDMKADRSPIVVNEWVEENTEGLIETIVPKDEPLYPCELLAVNAIYLKASWTYPFQEDKTNLDNFYTDSTRTTVAVQAHFMNGVLTQVPYSDTALHGYQVVGLPFAASTLSMLIVIPTGSDSREVTSSDFLTVLDQLSVTRAALSMPKFRFESEYDEELKQALIQAGIKTPFLGESSLCGLFEDDVACDLLAIDKVIQKTVIDVKECGVEAAAATAIKVFYRSAPRLRTPVKVMIDHPFQFFIYDAEQRLVIFEGHLDKPDIPKKEPEVELLNAKHSDSNFWSANFGVNPIDPLDNSSENRRPQTSPSSPRKRMVCIDLGRHIGRHIFFIPSGQFRWLSRARIGDDGAAPGRCDQSRVRHLTMAQTQERRFCYRAGSRTVAARAPAAAQRWLRRRGATERNCRRYNLFDEEIHMRLIE